MVNSDKIRANNNTILMLNPDTTEGWMTKEPRFNQRQGQEIYLMSERSKVTLGSIHLPTQLVSVSFSLGLKWPGR